MIRPRLRFLSGGIGIYVIGLVSAAVAITMPPLESLPFAATTAGVAIALFGLALVTRDGLLALLGFVMTGGIVFLLVKQFF